MSCFTILTGRHSAFSVVYFEFAYLFRRGRCKTDRKDKASGP